MSISTLPKDKMVYELMKKSLDASSIRGKVIANNIANVNTKGYKRFNVSFEENLKTASDNLEMKSTSEKHIRSGNDFGEIKVEQDNSYSMREDGNNVDIDNEKANQAANTLMYNALITQINGKLSNTKYVINGGR